MGTSEQSDDLSSIAQGIMYGDQYLDLISDTYSDNERIAQFEINPRYYLERHGIRVPDAIDVVIPTPGALGKPPHVEFRWASRQSARARVLAARRAFRELARLARATLDTREMKGLIKELAGNEKVLAEFSTNPVGYLKTRGISIPDELELVPHLEDKKSPRIDLHFNAHDSIFELALDRGWNCSGCCVCTIDYCGEYCACVF